MELRDLLRKGTLQAGTLTSHCVRLSIGRRIGGPRLKSGRPCLGALSVTCQACADLSVIRQFAIPAYHLTIQEGVSQA